MAYSLSWLADVLRSAGLNVVEEAGWRDRGRGEMGVVLGVLCHHTGGPLRGNDPSLPLIINGRPDLAGPLSQLFLARDGTFHVVAAGRCNHAGAGIWHGVSTGNSSFVGIEAENAGTAADPWPPVQFEAYQRGVAAILKHSAVPAMMCAGHKEFAMPKGRKIDPTFDMNIFREGVASFMAGVDRPAPLLVVPAHPVEPMLKRGDHGPSVQHLQAMLRLEPDGVFGPGTESAVKAFQSKHGLVPDGFVGPKSWAAIEGAK